MVSPSEYGNSSRVMYIGPCIVKSVHAVGPGSAGAINIYDGVNANGIKKARIDVLTNAGYTWRPGDGTDFDFGIYIEVIEGTVEFTVTYSPESPKKFI